MMGEYDAGCEHYIDGLHREIIDYQIEVEQVKGENAKLRELVRDMGAAFIHGPCYRWCEFKEPCNGDRCQYRDRMRELGVDA